MLVCTRAAVSTRKHRKLATTAGSYGYGDYNYGGPGPALEPKPFDRMYEGCTSAGLHGTESDVCTHPLAISLLAIFYVYVPVISAYNFDTCNAGVCCLWGQFKFCSLGRAKIMSRNHICNM